MVIEGGLHAWFWVWVESLRWLRQGVVVLMLFCSDQMMGDGFGRGFDKSDNDGRVVMWWWCREVMWRPVSQWWWDWERDGSTIKVRGGDGGWWWLWWLVGVNSKEIVLRSSSKGGGGVRGRFWVGFKVTQAYSKGMSFSKTKKKSVEIKRGDVAVITWHFMCYVIT